MKMPKRGEKGFTLIELLIVIAILGVLAAVIIPNVGRFFGRGEDEARKTEKDSVQAAVDNMMADNGVAALSFFVQDDNATHGDYTDDTHCKYGGTVGTLAATNNMTIFPDTIADNDTGAAGTQYSDGGGKVTDPAGTAYDFSAGDKEGFVLNGHDVTADSAATATVDYIRETTTVYYYTIEADGTVHQYETADETLGEL